MASSVSYCCSSLIGGYFGNNVDRHMYLFFAMFISGASRLAIPFSRSLWDYTVIMVLVGLSNAAIDIGANSWLLGLWSRGMSNMYMQGMHFTWAVGSSISPLIAEPFLSKTINKTVTIFNDQTSKNETNILKITTQSTIVIPFTICGVLHLICCSILLFLYCLNGPIESDKQAREEEEEGLIEGDEDLNFSSTKPSKMFLIIMAGIVIGLETGMEVNTFNYLTVFAVGHKYSKSTGAFLLSALTVCFTLSRGISTIAASKLPIEWILYCSLTTISIAITILTFFADAGGTYMWIGFCLIGFGFGPFYAGTFSYLSQKIHISTAICGMYIFLSSLSVIVSDLTVGKLIVEHLYVYNLFNVISCILTVILFIMLRIVMRRFDQIPEKARTSSWSKAQKISED